MPRNQEGRDRSLHENPRAYSQNLEFFMSLLSSAFDLVILGFALAILFDHVKGLLSSFPNHAFWDGLFRDMSNSPLVWTLFILLLFFWALFKAWLYARQMKQEEIQEAVREARLRSMIETVARARDDKLIQAIQEQTRTIVAALGQLEPKGRDEEY